ncbi:MAG: ABC transporter permease [bacterium]
MGTSDQLVTENPTEELVARRHRWGGMSLGMIIGLVILGVLVVVASSAPHLATDDPLEQDLAHRLAPPSADHWFGTDRLGRDIYSRLLHGARVSLITATLVVVFSVSLGVVLGLVSGFYGGGVDFFAQRVIDVIMAFPGLLLAIAIMAFLGQGVLNVVLAMSIVNLAKVTRVARAVALQVRQEEYVDAARAVGARDSRILSRHIFPGMLGPIIVRATFTLVYAIRTEATLSFIGLGVPPPHPSWGGLLSAGRAYVQIAPWITVAPGVAIALTILSLTLIGDWLRDRFDPRA